MESQDYTIPGRAFACAEETLAEWNPEIDAAFGVATYRRRGRGVSCTIHLSKEAADELADYLAERAEMERLIGGGAGDDANYADMRACERAVQVLRHS